MKDFGKYLKTHCKGVKNAKKSPELEIIFKCSGTDIRAMVNDCRCLGIPVCSGQEGYYYASNQEELNQTIANLNSRITKIEAARNGLLSLSQKEKTK